MVLMMRRRRGARFARCCDFWGRLASLGFWVSGGGALSRACCVSLCAFCAVTGLVAQESKGEADAAAQFRLLTDRRFEANAANDRTFYERLLAENALVLLPNRRPMTKSEYLDHEFGSRPSGQRGVKAGVVDFRALVAGDTAVVSYLAIEPTPLGDQTFELRTGRLDTYVRRGGEWRLVSMSMVEPPTWPDVAKIDPRLYSEYAGTYQLSPDSFVVVTNEAGHLMGAMTGQSKSELFPESETTFFDRTDSPYARIIFERDSTGQVVAQIYRLQGQRLRATKVK